MLDLILSSIAATERYPFARNFQASGSRRPFYEMSKRLFDCVVAALGILALTPVFLMTALAVRLDSKGSALYSQDRVGRDGVIFRCWKFRSMYTDADERKAELMKQNEMAGGILFKMKDDPRITRVGKFIRKASIDELPQLWNVFIGDMSLVGPRPAVPAEVAQYTTHERGRLQVKPGITCLWQVSGRSDLNFEEQVRLDLKYAENRSMKFDISLLFKTIPAVLFARGAY